MEKKNTHYRTRLGIFVVVGVALFIFAIFWIGRQKHFFSSTFSVVTNFNSVSGLQVGNNVRFSGINVGTVDAIDIVNDTSVVVVMLINKNVQPFIKKNSIASIGSEGLMGDRIISISQGMAGDPPVKDNDKLRSTNPVDTDVILSNLEIVTGNTAVITDQLAEIMVKLNSGQGTIGRLISDSTLAGSFLETMQNLEQGTQGFSENMEAAKHNFLLRGFFKRKQKEAERMKEEKEEKAREKEKKENK